MANCPIFDSGALSDPKQKWYGETSQLQKRFLLDIGASLEDFDVILYWSLSQSRFVPADSFRYRSRVLKNGKYLSI